MSGWLYVLENTTCDRERKISCQDAKNVELSNRFTALENLKVNKYISRAWENITDNDKNVTKGSLRY